jgi:hypothetical protein
MRRKYKLPKDLEEIFSSFFGATFALLSRLFVGPMGRLQRSAKPRRDKYVPMCSFSGSEMGATSGFHSYRPEPELLSNSDAVGWC